MIFTNPPRFNSDPVAFISSIHGVLKNNLFETYIQRNDDIIDSIILSSYKYTNNKCIKCDNVKSFLNWFQTLSIVAQELVLSNISAKFSQISIEEDDDELPF